MTQPTATIIAACIAVAAAATTLFGVWLNIRHQTKLDDRKAHREREETRRQERMTLFAEVLSLAAQANQMVWAKMNGDSTESLIKRSDKPSRGEEFSGVIDVVVCHEHRTSVT